jgi:NitT/TauT family transport system substrate-binding protein
MKASICKNEWGGMLIDRRSLLTGATALGVAAAAGEGRSAKAAGQDFTILLATVPPDPAYHYHFYALENGFYAKHGLNVKIKSIRSDTTTMRGLISGEGDIACAVGPKAALQVAQSGSHLKCISSFTPKLDYAIIGEKNIKDLKSLEGHLFGITQLGSLSHLVPSLMIKAAGGDPNKVKWVSIGNSAARLQATIAKRVEAAAVNSSLARRGLQYDYLHVISSAAEDLPHFLYGWDVTTADLFNKKKDAYKSYVEATSEGAKWGMANREKAVAISQKVLPDMPKADVAAAVNAFMDKHFWNESGVLPRATWDFTTKILLDAGIVKSVPKFDDFVVNWNS